MAPLSQSRPLQLLHRCSLPFRRRGHFLPPAVHTYVWRPSNLPQPGPQAGQGQSGQSSVALPRAQRSRTPWEQPLYLASKACELLVGVTTQPAEGASGWGDRKAAWKPKNHPNDLLADPLELQIFLEFWIL